MGGCLTKKEADDTANQPNYVTESDDEDDLHGSISASSSDTSFDESMPLVERTEAERMEAFQRNRELDPETLTCYDDPVKMTDKCVYGISDDGYRWVNEYIVLKTLGKGSYGKVKLCLDRTTGQSCAMKICNKTVLGKKRKGGLLASTFLDDVRKEISILRYLDHPNITRLFEVIDDEEDDKLYMVFEYVPHGPLMKGVVEQEPLDMNTAWRYCRDIIRGIEYLHHLRIIHRDIKPENLLRGEEEIKISDFGVSHVFTGDDDTLKRTEGSPAFLAPEILSGGEFAGKGVDIWAFGVTMYVFIFGTCPFMAESEYAIYEQIRVAKLEFPHPVDARLKDLLEGILEKDVTKRLTLPQMKVHPWVTMNGAFPLEDTEYPEPHFTAEDIVGLGRQTDG